MSKVWYKNAELIIAVSALITSVVAVVTSLYSAKIDRDYARASVWPRIEIYRSFRSAGTFDYNITNSGTGPAVIKHAVVKLDGEPVQRWRQITNALSEQKISFTQSHMGNRILPSQQTIHPLLIKSSLDISEFLRQESKRVTITLCYCSFYDDCWETDRMNQPKEVEQCAVNEKDRFLQ